MADKVSTIPARKIDIVNTIQEKILSGEWTPLSQLPSERELASDFSVSRPVIREALAGLVELGFIEIHPGRGSFVRDVRVDDLSMSLSRAVTLAHTTARDLVVARVGLECSAVELAASQENPNVDKLWSTLNAHATATGVQNLALTDLEFHEACVRESNNPVLVLMFGAIRTQVFAIMLRSHSDPSVQSLGEPFHEKIVQAIADRDSARARDLMREHLELALNLYGQDLDRPISEVVESRGLATAATLNRVT